MPEHLVKLISQYAETLKKAGIDRAKAEVEIILCSLLNIDRLKLYLNGLDAIDQITLSQLEEIVAKRTTRYPLQYILEESYFYGRKFFVSPAVMVPTPETEVLVEAALGFVRSHTLEQPRILDIGVGSGVISVTLACELPQAKITALDLSVDALEVARKNGKTMKVTDRIEFYQSDLFDALIPDHQFDLILSNPPYIAEPDYDTLPPEVLADPKISLVGGSEGLDIIRRLLASAPEYLAPHGRIMFEIGYDQAVKVAHLTEADQRYATFTHLKDLNDIDRVVILGCE